MKIKQLEWCDKPTYRPLDIQSNTLFGNFVIGQRDGIYLFAPNHVKKVLSEEEGRKIAQSIYEKLVTDYIASFYEELA